MKLSNYIKYLQESLEEHGDLTVVYASDDEGNNYQKVEYTPSVAFFENLDAYHLELIAVSRWVDDDVTDENKALVIN